MQTILDWPMTVIGVAFLAKLAADNAHVGGVGVYLPAFLAGVLLAGSLAVVSSRR